jgi:hypothetical protein
MTLQSGVYASGYKNTAKVTPTKCPVIQLQYQHISYQDSSILAPNVTYQLEVLCLTLSIDTVNELESDATCNAVQYYSFCVCLSIRQLFAKFFNT